MKRRLLAIALLVAALVGGTASQANASNNCPSGSRFKGNAAGGVCIGLAGEGIVKIINNLHT